MDWPLVIKRNCDALKPIIAALFAMGGRAWGGPGSKLPRSIYAAVMFVLRPAESALRRLIVIAARGLVLTPRAQRPLPAGLPAFSDPAALRVPAFSLFDPLKHFSPDDFDQNASTVQRIGFFSFYGEEFAHSAAAIASPQEPVDAASLFLRLHSLKRALSDLNGQARRLARWRARRDLALKRKGPFRPMRMSACRPGLPPGYRKNEVHAVDHVLRECHYFAREAMNAPDTS